MMRTAFVILLLAYSTAAQEPTCEVTPLSATFAHWGGTQDFQVTGDRAWVPAPGPGGWIVIVGIHTANETAENPPGNGPGFFTVGVLPNTTNKARSDFIRVGGRLITITQKRGPGKR